MLYNDQYYVCLMLRIYIYMWVRLYIRQTFDSASVPDTRIILLYMIYLLFFCLFIMFKLFQHNITYWYKFEKIIYIT